MINSRAKGKTGELELAAVLSNRGFAARRGRQFSGNPEAPDIVVEIPGVHVECKRVETGNPYRWLAQAQRDAGGKIPVVMHRRSRQPWIAVLLLDDFLTLIEGDHVTASTEPREA